MTGNHFQQRRNMLLAIYGNFFNSHSNEKVKTHDGATTRLFAHCKTGNAMHQKIWRESEAFEKEKVSESGMIQSTIGERMQRFDPAILRELLTNWIATSDKAFIELENPWLLKAFEYANPKALIALKTANTVRSDIKQNYLDHQQLMIERLKVCNLINLENSLEN